MHLISEGNSQRVLPARPMNCWELASFEVETSLETRGKELVQVTVEHLPGRQMYFWMIGSDAEKLGIIFADGTKPARHVQVWFVFNPDNGCMPVGALGDNRTFIPYCADRDAVTARWEEWRQSIVR